MEKLQSQIQPLLDLFNGQPYMQSAIILLLTLLLANLLTWITLKIFGKLTSLTHSQLDDFFLHSLRTPMFYTILMMGFSMAARLLPISESLRDGLISTLQTIGIIVWMVFFLRIAKVMIRHIAEDEKRLTVIQNKTLPLFLNLALILIVVMAIYMIFSVWGIDMTAWLASAGIVGMAIGFAAKDTLANLFSGVFILADTPYKIGDYIVLDSGERGAVTHIGIRSTRMLTRDDVELTIPNSIMGNTKVINESGGPHLKYRIRIPVGVSYDSDIDLVRKTLIYIANQCEKVVDAPTARVRFRALGESSLDFQLLCWIAEPWMRGQVTDILLTQIYKIFKAKDIEIPYSKRDIYIREMPKSFLAQPRPNGEN
jgi:small-conductance mechanosensitive channel